MNKHRLSLITVCCALLLLFVATASAQEATIVGTVTDPSGAVVPGATVKITNVETGVVRTITTEENGQYVVPELRIGHYTVRVEAAGFKSLEKTDIVLQVGDRVRVDAVLQLGATSESIKVEANPIAVQSDSGEISQVITPTQITQIATNGRTIYNLAVLTPGVANNNPGFQAPTAQGSSTNLSFNGLRIEHNLFIADGAEQDDRGGASRSIIAPSMDAIAEFQVLSSNYDAQYGLSSSATVSMVFKSGTKDFHGGAWEFVRNDAFDANTFFRNRSSDKATNSVPPFLRLNTFGFNVGGPVTLGHIYNKDRNKTFFFYNMEWRRMITAGTINQLVPNPSVYGGNFTGYVPGDKKGSDGVAVPNSGLHVPCAFQIAPTLQNALTGAGLALSTPGSDGSCSVNGKLPGSDPGQPHFSPFPLNTIPAGLVNSNAKGLLAAGIFPSPNSSNGNFVGGNKLPTNLREELLRVDHHFNDKFWLFGHWVAEPTSQSYGPPMWSGVNVPTVGNTFSNPSYTGVVHATYSISPTALLESAFNYDGNRITIAPTGLITAPVRSTIKELFPDNRENRLPGIVLSSTGTNYDVTGWPWNNSANDYQIREDFSWTKGAHSMKMGGSWAIYKKIQDLNDVTQGRFTFNGSYTGNDMADFLLGYASGYHELALQDAGHWYAQSWAAYFQDNWRVNNRLTLNLGLRWDGIPHTYEANHRMANFYPSMWNTGNAAVLNSSFSAVDPSSPGLGTSPVAALSAFKFYLNGIGITGVTAGAPNGMTNTHWNAWGPRIGLAYDLTGSGKTVIRAGIGAMYERIQGNDMYNGGGNVPFSAAVDSSGVSLDNPGVDLKTGNAVVNPIPIASITGISLNDFKNPVTWSYSASVQRQVGKGTVLQAAYVGNKSMHQFAYRQINLPFQSALPGIISGAQKFNNLVPFRGFGSIRIAENSENAHYNSMQVSVRSQFKDLSLQGSYTLSRAVDPCTNFGSDNNNTVYNPYNRDMYTGPSFTDSTHIAVVSFVYDIPLLRHSASAFAKSVVGGWQMSGVLSLQSGFPLNIINLIGGGNGNNNGIPNTQNVPNYDGKAQLTHTVNQWFTTSGFSNPDPGTWGNYNRQLRGPGRNNWNIAMFKNFAIRESMKFELRIESFNTFNHTQFNGVQVSAASSQFGQVTSVWDPRQLQFGAKFLF